MRSLIDDATSYNSSCHVKLTAKIFDMTMQNDWANGLRESENIRVHQCSTRKEAVTAWWTRSLDR